MKRLLDNLAIDLVAAGMMLGMLASGYILRFPLPPGSNKSLSLWGLSRHEWGTIHFWISMALLAVILLHLCMHWQWVVISIKRRLSRSAGSSASPLRTGLVTLAVFGVIFALFAWLANASIETVTGPRKGVCAAPAAERRDAVPDEGLATTTTMATGSQPAGVSWGEVYPLLKRSCITCHGPDEERGGFRIDRREDYFRRSDRAPLVVPGKSSESRLIAIVSGRASDMPLRNAHQLPKDEVERLKAWIDAGAPR